MLNFTLCAATVVALASVAQADTVGFRTAGVGGAEPRPLNVAFWYPTEETGPEIEFGATPAFVGFTAIDDAEPSAGEHPLVVLSHGYGGTWRSLAWLGVALAERGYVVAAPDHPGTTYFNRDRRQAGMLWERPHDLSRVIDAVLRDPALAGEIDPDRIAAVGHSIGGWTVSALAGARFDPDRFARDCTTEIVSRACPDNPGYDMPDLRMNAEPLRQDMSDPRVRAFVSLDLGLARGFTPESLSDMTVPALLVGAGINIGDRPVELETGWLVQNMPAATTEEMIVSDAMHFSFMQLCHPGAVAMIEREEPGEGIVCRDGGTRGRATIHADLLGRINVFLDQALSVR
ncbi:MAG: alpha/beta fold hydrolase [Maritimibacter sp.]|nr:alpha/beta fold hydrolase [Maritimibacter sp.]